MILERPAEGPVMPDPGTPNPIRVLTDDVAPPYLRVRLDELDRVRAILQEHDIAHWVDHYAISVDGRPALVVIHLDRKCDPNAVQEILNRAA
jgi:hypothetical protein